MVQMKKAVIGGLLTGLFGFFLIPFMCDLEENLGLDLLFMLRGKRPAPDSIVVVTLDKVSATQLNLPPEPYKWPRSLHAELVDNLSRQGAAAIAFDIIFKEPGPVEIDNRFADAIRRAGNVILCKQLDKDSIPLADPDGMHPGSLEIESVVPLIPSIAQSAMGSAPFPLPKVPVKVSQYWTFKQGAGDIPTLPVVTFQAFALDVYDDLVHLLETVDPGNTANLPGTRDEVLAAGRIEDLVQALRYRFQQRPSLADRMLAALDGDKTPSPDLKRRQVLKALIRMYEGGNSHYLNYYGPPGAIRTLPYYQLVPYPVGAPFEPEPTDLKGKAVFVGLSERLRPEEKDGFYTAYSQASGVDISGVEIAATAFANLMESAHVRPLSRPTHLAVVFLSGLIMGLFCRLSQSMVAAAGLLVMNAAYFAGVHYQFKTWGIWSPIVVPMGVQAPLAFFGTLIWKYLETHRERQNVRRALGYYVPGGVADQMARNMGDIRASRQVFRGTLLCTDAENYTALSEALDPETLARVMNAYFETIFGPVKKNKGTVSEVVADSMIAVWEGEASETIHRVRACDTALGIARALQGFNRANPGAPLPTRMGLHTGQMMVGNIGAMDRYEYNPIGDIVNTASRIEGLNKHLGTRILASREVVHGLDEFLTRDLGEFVLAGKSQPVAVHELMGRKHEAGEREKILCATFPDVLDAYRNRDWEAGIRMLSDLLGMNGGDGPSRFFLALCKKCRERPAADAWDGRVYLGKK